MKRFFPSSLRARLIIGAIIGITIGVSAAGIFISALFLQQATELVDGEMRGHLDELASIVDVDARGEPELYRPLSDPRFSQVGSGLSWQVSRDGTSLIKSTSASSQDLPVPMDNLAEGGMQKLTLNGHDGPMMVYERILTLEGAKPLRLQVNADPLIVESVLRTFNIALFFSLGLLALALTSAAALQVGFGLQPMTRLRGALATIKSGKAARLPRAFPSEVQPLVDDLNGMIEVNNQMVLRARTQAGNLAHALKTPLAVLTDEAYRLETRGEAESAHVILQQCQRMQRQIDYQIARARAAASRAVPGVIAPVAPAALSIVSAMKRLYAPKNLRFEIDVGDDVIVSCDPMDLNEMLANLLDNACKWASQTIVVRALIEGERVIIVVEDDGPGLPAEAMEVVFNIGERLDEQVPGSGLGLPIVRDLAGLYGGEIKLEHSALGGLKAILTLPRTR
jgi:signal transduction histidine kinase